MIRLDIVTADGEQIYCDADTCADLYWAARGSGPGFFALVTSFHLKLYPKPAGCGSSMYAYPFECADEIFTWARSISAEMDRRVEPQIVAFRSVPAAGLDGPAIVFASPSFADTEDEAEKSLALLTTCPVIDQAVVKIPYMPTNLPTWYTAMMHNYLADHRYAADSTT